MESILKAYAASLLVVAAVTGSADNLLPDTRFSPESGWGYWVNTPVVEADGTLALVDGKAVATSPAIEPQVAGNIQLIKPLDVAAEKLYRLTFKASADKAGDLTVLYCLNQAPYTGYANVNVAVAPGEKPYRCILAIKADKDGNYDAPRSLRLFLGGFKDATVSVSDVSLTMLPDTIPWTGEPLSFTGTVDKATAVYQPGEQMVFSIQLLAGAKPVAGQALKWTRTGDDQKTESGEATSSDSEPLRIVTSTDKPGFVRIDVTALDNNDLPRKDANGAEVKFDGGAGVGLEQLAGFPEPADFDTFWVRQKAKLADVPMKATLTPVPAGKPGFLLFDVNVDCAGGKPVSGYLTMPEGAAPGSLQAKVGFEGYGVRSAAQEYLEGKLVFNTNAHGIANGQDAEYYAKLQTGELAGYALSQNDNPDTCYFNGMMLRVLRALEFVKARPEWDGKNLAVGGGSQGGFQALVAAGLDREVTACFAFKPWCCDLGGINLGRLRGWRPDYTAALAYYDPVNHAKRITCETRIIAGLGDYVCPPSGLTVLYNNIAAPKQIDYIQGSTHGYDPPDPAKFALGTIPR